ncbi:trypsin-like peptidase domain-containing protein [Streptomyces albogriseolus]|uniref:trypsin-like peptidase domain-containing protein n=1 Tax=Streptomyces albogriseolus TaxID=1887 RepID=UPI0038132F65
MNEGKPGTPGASEGPDGDFELARPIGTASPGTGPDGDYELRRPLDTAAAPPSTDGTSGAGAAAGPGRLGGTPGAVASGTGAELTPAGPDAVTTIGGARPADTGAEHITGVETAEHGAPAAPAPHAEPPASGHSGPAPVPGAEAPASGHSGPAPAPGAEAPASGPTRPAPAHGAHAPAQPRPLHDPDPYSTPPYGEPGPWAPAPPVQHPAATPAHGVAVGAPEAVSAAPVAQEAPAADPWARYDPWAAPAVAPLQQADPVEEDVKRRRGRRRRTLIGGALIIALVSGVAGGVVGVQLERSGGIGAVELPQAGVEAPDRDPDSVAGIAAQALPSVVTLHVSGGGRAGTGTGFVLDDRGHILTNDHVVEPAGENGDITVTFHSGDTAEATVVGRDSGYDLAVVRVKGVRGLTPLPLGNSDNVQVGDPVVAIGAPFDLAGTVTSGIISARERPITAGGEKGDGSDVSYVDALQTDAPINPGNSGGPLLDGKGRVIGINSAIRSADGGLDPEGGQSGSIGLGFAIPINQGKRVAEELIETGKATHPVIGITLDMEYSGDGARVAAEGSDGGPPVSTGGPGAKAGIRPGDVITEVDGRPVHSGEELIVKTRAHRPGDRLELTLERDGEERTVSLVLGSSGGG